MEYLAEQFLRVIYAFQLSGSASDAKEIFKSFAKKARQELSTTGYLDYSVKFRLSASKVILDDSSTPIDDLVGDGEPFSSRLAEAWGSKDLQKIESCAEELEQFIEHAENDDEDMAPWSDVWHYILVRRLERLLDQIGR